MKKAKDNILVRSLFGLVIISLCLAGAHITAFAQVNAKGSVSIGYIGFDGEGNRSGAFELFDTYDGFAINNIRVNGNFNERTRYFLDLTDVNFDGRKASLDITNFDYFSLKANYRQTRRIFDSNASSSEDSKFYSGRFQVNPLKGIAGYLEYRGNKYEGDRVVYGISDQGLFGDSYDSRTGYIKSGVKLNRNGNYLDISYATRKYDDRLNNSLDSKARILGANLFVNALPQLKALVDFQNIRSKKDLSGDEIKENRFGLSFLTKPWEKLLLTPKAVYRKVSGVPNDPDFLSYFGGIGGEYRLPHRSNISASIGYEIREADTNRTTAIAYSFGLKGRPFKRFGGKLKFDSHNRRDTYDVLLTGYENRIGFIAEADLYLKKETTVKVGFKSRIRENKDIDTKSESSGFYLKLGSKCRKIVKAFIVLSAEDVKYTSPGEVLDYKLKTASGNVMLTPGEKIILSLGGAVLDFNGDIETAKLDLTTSISYRFCEQIGLNISYRRYELDGLNLSPTYYEANIINVGATFYFEK